MIRGCRGLVKGLAWLQLVEDLHLVRRLKEIVHCRLDWLLQVLLGEVVDAESSLTNGVEVVADERDLIVTVELGDSLERSAQVEQDFAVTQREHLCVPLIQALGYGWSRLGVTVDHLHDQLDDLRVFNALLKLVKRIVKVTSELLQLGKVKQWQTVHHNFSDDATD